MHALFLGLVLVTPAATEDKKEAPAGTWTRESSGAEITFAFTGKDAVTVTVAAGENGLVAKGTFAVDKKGAVKVTITEVKELGNFPAKPPKGFEFGFKWTVKGDVATLDDLTGDKIEDAKSIVEGEYTRVKPKKK
jgi:hypothetical protein